jgi:putative CocE/NonD family hydrolase
MKDEEDRSRSFILHFPFSFGTVAAVRRRALWVSFAVALALATGQPAGRQAGAGGPPRFDMRDVMIEARDGTRLHTRIFTPRGAAAPLPLILQRTPYGVDDAEGILGSSFAELAADGYIFVFQDIRGRYGSGGSFVMMRPVRDRADARAIDESTDAYDTIEWLLKNAGPNNGRVGMLGVSYDGWTTAMAALDPHPALEAASPQASPADMWLGDDFHHNGAFRLSYGFEYAAMMETTRESTTFAFDRYDTYQWYLALGPLSTVNARYLHGRIPTWNNFVAHPDYDRFWQRQTLVPAIRESRVPTLNVAGWWDQEDFYGPIRIYDEFERFDGTKHLSSLVVGPWNHGGWNAPEGRRLGDIDFGSATSKYFRAQVQAPWFAYWLKGTGELHAPEALTFEAGTNQWRSWAAWPPASDTAERRLYFRADGELSFEPPAGDPAAAEPFDGYISDPAHPVPYRHRPIQPTYFDGGSGWYTWLLEDQRFVDDRADVVSWETPPLPTDLTVAGEIVAHLFASTSGTDSDWIVKLIDVYPEQYPADWKMAGRQLMVSNDVFRGRYLGGFDHAAPLVPGRITPVTFSLHTQDYCFRKGHRVMVQVQSSWFPLIDRNPQTFVANIFEAKASDYRPAAQRIYRSAAHPSHVSIPVVKR